MRRLSILCAVAFVASALSAQSSYVIPKSVGTGEGNTYMWTPLRYNPSHSQFFYDATEVGTGVKVFSQLALRRDGNLTTAYVKKTIDVEVRMNNIAALPAQQSWLFSANMKGGMTVFKRKKLNITAPAQPKVPPAPFTEVFKFDTKFPYTGKTLAIDIQTFHAKETGYWYVDAHNFTPPAGSTPDYGGAVVGASGCPSTFTSHRTGGNWPGAAIGLYGYSRVAANTLKPGLLMIGASKTKWGTITLPLKFDSIGGAGCYLGVSPDIMLPVVTDKTRTDGYVYTELPVPNDPKLGGTLFHFQFLVVDPSYNKLGLRMSRSYTNVIGKHGYTKPLPGFMLYNYYSQPSYDVGIYNKTRVPVMELQ